MTTILFILMAAMIGLYCLVRNKRRERIFSNTAPRAMKTHEGGIVTCFLDATITSRHLLGKFGSASNTVDVCGATNRPMGVMYDLGNAGESVPVHTLGAAAETLLMIPSVAISRGDVLYTAAAGKVTNVSATGAYAVGIALTDGVANGLIEVDPRAPLTAES
jgi:hypothetical protein